MAAFFAVSEGLRQRQQQASPGLQRETARPQKQENSTSVSSSKTGWTFLLLTALAASVAVPLFVRSRQVSLSLDQLRQFDGQQQSLIYLAVLGKIFDVSRNPSMYGQGGAYASLVAKDGSRAFATGNFAVDVVDNVEGLTDDQLAAILDWQDFYAKDYRPVGTVAGRFYDGQGQPTELLRHIQAIKIARRAPQKAAAPGTKPCSIRWDTRARTISCSNGLYPRNIGKGVRECACFSSTVYGPSKRLYQECEPTASICTTPSAALKP